MKKSLTIFLLLVIGAVVFIQAQQETQTEQQTAVQAVLNEAAMAYKEGKYAEAQQYCEKALSLDPINKKAMIFLARTIHAQYRPGNESPENISKAYQAITAYQTVIANEPTNEESYPAIVGLYGAVKEETLQRQWIYQWANNPMVEARKRANAFALLASQNWNCVYTITEASKQTKGTKIIWVKPKNKDDYEKAKQCAAEGMSEAEQGIILDSESELAWTYKTNLLRERMKLAEMEGNKIQREEFYKQAEEASKRMNELAKANRKEKADDSPSTVNKVIEGGVLNGKAISLPKPKYPNVDVSGTVTVQITIDEEGNVIEAKAVSGPEPLRESAVEAAKKAKFSKTFLSGQPIKVTGKVVYNFLPQ